MKRSRQLLLLALLLLAGLGLLLFPGQVTAAARESLNQCVTVVIPSLFPFLVLSSLLISLGFGEALSRRLGPKLASLFRVSGAGMAALLLGLVGGYPVGARVTAELRQAGLISQREANRLLTFCNNCGPAFLLSTAGVAVLGSLRAGWILWAGHVLGALAVGILFPAPSDQGETHTMPRREAPPLSQALTQAVIGGAHSVLHLSAFVVLFGVILRLLTVSHILGVCARGLGLLLSPLGISPEGCATLLAGSLELTGGILSLSGRQATPEVLALAAFLLAWGGVSVHCQTMAVLSDGDWKLSGYLLGKLFHGILASAFTWELARLFPLQEPVQLLVSLERVGITLHPARLLITLGWLSVGAVCLHAIKKGGKNLRNRV